MLPGRRPLLPKAIPFPTPSSGGRGRGNGTGEGNPGGVFLIFALLQLNNGSSEHRMGQGIRTPQQQPLRREDWLTRYGYLPPPDPLQARLQTQEGLSDAIKLMQKFAGLQETGMLDERTLAMMDQPRCSLPDIIGTSELMRRRKRYAHSGSVWAKKQLTWSLSQAQVRSLLFYALQAWSNASALTFLEVPSDSADILVEFSRSFHQDGYPFDGPGSTLAHAFFPGEHPISGDTHFDDEETWIYDPHAQAQDLFAVAVHEFGHALGLAHSTSKESIMMPYYQGPQGLPYLYQLPPDDTLGIQTLYVSTPPIPTLPHTPSPLLPFPLPLSLHRSPLHWALPFLIPSFPISVGNIQPTPVLLIGLSVCLHRPRPPAPDRCQAHFDAIANIRGEVFFFKRQRFWVFADTQVDRGSPRPTTDLGLPPGVTVEAAFVWGHNGKTYFFEGTRYWRFDDWAGTVEPGYPRPLTLWKGVPSGLDDVISWNDGKWHSKCWELPWRYCSATHLQSPLRQMPHSQLSLSFSAGSTYFFKGTQYWRFLGGSVEADSGYPKSAPQDWMYCQGSPTASPAPGPRGGPGKPGGGQCLCSGAGPSSLPALLPWILALAWALR
uniref:Peptidase metallopeptidase domain-containing protein n=1 Tax=Pelusios castaneus TaxID=367368 RepID=A0A8C8VK35_9SAUR